VTTGASERPAGKKQARRAAPAGSLTPPPSVPLSFLAASAPGLVACGATLAWARAAAAADPTADPVVAAVHLGVLATLSVAVIGALHQFAPVVTHRPLRSVVVARMTFLTWLAASWLLPLGIATEQEDLAEAGGALAAVAVTLLVVNLWTALPVRGKGTAITGLRLAVAGLVVTACYGAVYVADRSGTWFDLTGHVVLAHAVVGLFGWLGLTYVTLAEKLWPMFLLANIPGRRRPGRMAVWAVAAGVVLLSPGLLLGVAGLAWAAAAVLACGLGAHLISLLAHVRHRRRGGLCPVFILTSAAWLVAPARLALAAAVMMGRDLHLGMALTAAAVTAVAGWLLEALAGHVHRVVPLVMWPQLRSLAVPGVKGVPPGLAELYDRRWAAAAWALLTAALAVACAGLAVSCAAAIAVAGDLLMATAIVMGAILAVRPVRTIRQHARGHLTSSQEA
jgi:hypothetical protein